MTEKQNQLGSRQNGSFLKLFVENLKDDGREFDSIRLTVDLEGQLRNDNCTIFEFEVLQKCEYKPLSTVGIYKARAVEQLSLEMTYAGNNPVYEFIIKGELAVSPDILN